ncbi:MAG: EF-Tu/IF-2/RF-3 family GTPase [Candidatus Micrarchaeota archaeon]|nr:EF-Tu/IF-2/RF-3 family GTPase [Candidatus Micrarchaeota archaeon]
MRNLGVAVIDLRNETAGMLAKKGTAADYIIYNRKTDDSVLCLYEPSLYPDKLASLLHCLNSSDIALLVFDGVGREIGECIVALDSLGMNGIFVLRDGTRAELAAISKGTIIEKYGECEYDAGALLQRLDSISPQRDNAGPLRIPVDSAFSVKSVGLVVLGIVKSGTVKVHDVLKAFPTRKEATVRSIQVQDKDVQEAGAGDRAGLCLKGVELEDVERGTELTNGEGFVFEVTSELACELDITRFQKAGISGSEDVFVSYGMQYAAGKVSGEVTPGSKGSVKISFVKPFSYRKGDPALLVGANRALRVIGKIRL